MMPQPKGRPDWTMRNHLACCAVCVVTALLAWTRPTLWQPTELASFSGRGALRSVRWEEGAVRVTLHTDAGGRLTVRREQAQGSAAPCVVTPAAEGLWRRLASLRPVRALGRLGEAQRRAAGLVQPRARLCLDAGATPARLAVGTTPWGRDEPFAEGDDGQAYLLPAGSLAPLRDGGAALCAD